MFTIITHGNLDFTGTRYGINFNKGRAKADKTQIDAVINGIEKGIFSVFTDDNVKIEVTKDEKGHKSVKFDKTPVTKEDLLKDVKPKVNPNKKGPDDK